jgi:oligopeptide transport system ATP-binding protein
MEPPVGCPFAARCKETMIVCQKYMPDYTDCGKNHKSACWMLDEMAQEVNSDEK